MTLHGKLKHVHARMSNPEYWNILGICNLLSAKSMNEFLDLAVNWPKHSGDRAFPVTNGSTKSPLRECSPDFTQSRTAYMWDRKNSEYAALRWELLEWAIEQTAQEAA